MLSQERLSGSQECERAWVEVDLEALAANTTQIKNWLNPGTTLMAVVKADAYGHGAVTVAETVLKHGASSLGVATIPEGIELRKAGIQAPILVLGAVTMPAQVRAIADWQLQPTLSSVKQALVFGSYTETLNSPLDVHLMIDTGMARLGCPAEEGFKFIDFVRRVPNLRIAGLYSHFAAADAVNPQLMRQQHQCFETILQDVQRANISIPQLHLANSAATLRDRSVHYDQVRVGLALYGLYPAPHLRDIVPLRPVLQVRSRITFTKDLKPGMGVSYGHQFVARRSMRIGVLGIGYADGVPRLLSNRMEVLLRGQRVRQVGAITMDQMMIDVSDFGDIQEGEVVTLLGEDGQEQITADTWAETLGTISWEILCGFKNRLPRIPVDYGFHSHSC